MLLDSPKIFVSMNNSLPNPEFRVLHSNVMSWVIKFGAALKTIHARCKHAIDDTESTQGNVLSID